MMNKPSPSKAAVRAQQLDRVAADLNVLLVVFAIGLATLDFTVIVTQRMVDRLPAMTRIVNIVDRAGSPSVPAGQQTVP